MRADELERVLRRIGRVFIAGLLLQPRISGQAILLPVFAGAMVWALWGLRPAVTSPEGQRGWQRTVGAAFVVTGLGALGWLPDMEPAGLSLAVLFAFIAGVLLYAAFVRGWAERAGWTDAADHLRRARVNLYGVAVTTALAVVAVVAFADRPVAGAPDPEWWNLVAGRVVGNAWVIGFFVLIFIGWIGASIELERGSKAVRAALDAEPGAPAPTA
jgi:hypothetical protein